MRILASARAFASTISACFLCLPVPTAGPPGVPFPEGLFCREPLRASRPVKGMPGVHCRHPGACHKIDVSMGRTGRGGVLHRGGDARHHDRDEGAAESRGTW